MSIATDAQMLINILNTGHPGSITSPNQAGLPEAFERFLAVTKSFHPDVQYQGEVQEVLSRRKARKLAYQYKGGNRSVRYVDFLAGRMTGFWIEGKRLVREPKTMRAKTIVLHADSVGATNAYRENLNQPVHLFDPTAELVSEQPAAVAAH